MAVLVSKNDECDIAEDGDEEEVKTGPVIYTSPVFSTAAGHVCLRLCRRCGQPHLVKARDKTTAAVRKRDEEVTGRGGNILDSMTAD